MLASFTVISRASSGLTRTSEAMELRVLKRKCGLIWRWRASRRASRRRCFCSSSFISMRRAFHFEGDAYYDGRAEPDEHLHPQFLGKQREELVRKGARQPDAE